MSKSWNDLAEIENVSQLKKDANNLLLVDSNNLSYRWIKRKDYNNFADPFQDTIRSLATSYKAKKTIACFDYGKSYYRVFE